MLSSLSPPLNLDIRGQKKEKKKLKIDKKDNDYIPGLLKLNDSC